MALQSAGLAELGLMVRRRSTWAILLLGLVLVGVSVLGVTFQGADALAAQGAGTPQKAMQLAISQAFAMGLFASVAGVIGMTRPLGDGSARLLFHARPSWQDILTIKATAAFVVGAIFGVVTAAATVLMAARGLSNLRVNGLYAHAVLWQLSGIVFLCAFSGAFGTFVGALGRRQTPTIIGLIVWTIGIEGGLIALVPQIGRWLPGGAIASVVGDLSVPERLVPAQGAILELVWVVLLGVAALAALRKWTP